MRDHFWTDTHSGEQCVNCGVYGRTGDDPGMCPGDPTENENKQLRADLAAMTERAERAEATVQSNASELFDLMTTVGEEQLRAEKAEEIVALKANLTADVVAARADVERLRKGLEELADEFECQVCQDDDELGQDDLAAARALLAETAPKGPT